MIVTGSSPVRRGRSARRGTARSEELRAPISGMNSRDNLSSMRSEFAIHCQNWICRTDGLVTRGGQRDWTTALGASVESLLPFRAKRRLLASVGGKVVDVTSINSNVDLITGASGEAWTAGVVSNPGTSIMLLANGVDTPRKYDGENIAACNITNVNQNKLTQPVLHQRRLFMIELGTMNLWYLEPGAIDGPAKLLNVAPLCLDGGHIVAHAVLKGDGGRGPDDRLVIVTSDGEIVIYTGTNPDEASTWSLQGVYETGKPTGPNCFANDGGDLYLSTDDGLVDLARSLAVSEDMQTLVTISDRIGPTWRRHESTRKVWDGWDILKSRTHGFTLVNAGDRQFIRESETRGWSEFHGFSARCWAEYDGQLFFGTPDGRVKRYVGHDDDFQPITSYVAHAYRKFRTPSRKRFSRARPYLDRQLSYRPRVEIVTDHKPVTEDFAPIAASDNATAWGGVALPTNSTVPHMSTDEWRGLTGRGQSGALQFAVRTTDENTYAGCEVQFETGGRL